MKRKRKLLAILMAVAMAWQGLSLAQAEELGTSGTASESTITTPSASSGVPSEEDIRAAQAKSEEEKVQAAGAMQTMALTSESGAATAENSKSIAVNITDASYTDSKGNAYNGSSVSNHTNLGIKVAYSIPNGQNPKSGDTTTIQLPDSFTGLKSEDFPIKSGNDLVASAHYDLATNTVTLTYSSFVETKSDIKVNFSISVQVNASKEPAAKDISGSLTVNQSNTFTIAGKVHYTGIEKDSDFKLVKDANQTLSETTDPQTGNKIKLVRYRILINLGEARNNLTLKDALGEGSFSYYVDDTHPVSIRKGKWQRGHFEGTKWNPDPINGKHWDLRNDTLTDGAPNIHAIEKEFKQNAPGKKNFLLHLGNATADQGYEIFYYVKFDGVPKANFDYKNDIEVDSDGAGGSPIKAKYDFFVQNSGGSGSGDNYSINIKKTDEDGAVLKGAKFAVANSQNIQVGTVSTDENGEAVLSDLLKDTYTVQEIAAPQGYLLSKEKYSITADSFDANKVAVLKVTNVKAGQKRSISVTKKWVDAGNKAQKRPNKVTVELLRNGQGSGTTMDLSQDNSWKAIFQDLPKYDEDGKLYNYSIRENAVSGYSPAISGTQSLGFTLTNTIDNKISIPVTKVWNGKGDHPASVTVRLVADGKVIATQVLSAQNNWQYTFTNLEKTKGGQTIQYKVTEDEVPGYSSSTSGDAASGYVNIFTNTKLKPNDPSNGGSNGGNGGGNGGNGGNHGPKPNVKNAKNPSAVLGENRDASKPTADGKTALKGEVKGEERAKDGSVLDASRKTKTGDQSRSMTYLFLFGGSAVLLLAVLYTEKRKKTK